MSWINPKTKMPNEGDRVLIKTKYLHHVTIRYARYETHSGFIEMESTGSTHDAKDVWGWVLFKDSNTRK